MTRHRNPLAPQSLRRRGLVLTVLAVLVLVEVITVAAVVTSQQLKSNEALDIHTRQLLQDVVDETRENAQGFLVQAENAVRLTQRVFASGHLSLERPVQLERYFFEQLGIVPHIDSLYFGTPMGQFIFVKRTRDKPGSEYVTKIIEREGERKRVYRVWRDASFGQVARADDPTDSYDPRLRPWYEGAITGARPYWTDPYVFFTSKQPGLTIALPLRSASGELRGVVGADVELSALSVFLARQVASIGAAVIVHKNGDVLAYSSPEQLPRSGAGDHLRLARLDELDAVTTAASRALSSEYPTLSMLDAPYFGRFRTEGDWYRVAFVRFLEQERWPWVMGVYAREDRFAGSIRQGQRQSLVYAIVISVLMTAAAFLLGPRLMRPLADLQAQAGQDPLTGLLNRRSFMELATDAFEGAQRTGAPLAAIMLDVDRFKAVNDTHGHPVGDEVLKAVAGRIGRGLSQLDLLSRYGGEEFAIVLPEATLEEAATVAGRLNRLIESPPIATGVGPISVTISLGVAARSAATDSIAAVLSAADRCLLEAKRNGRNRVRISALNIDEPIS